MLATTISVPKIARYAARIRAALMTRARAARTSAARSRWRADRGGTSARARACRASRDEPARPRRRSRRGLRRRALRGRRLALEGVQDDAPEQIAEREVERGRERRQHLEQPALEAHAGLGAGDLLHGTMVPSYQFTIKRAAVPPPSAVSDAAAPCFDRRGSRCSPLATALI